MPQLVTLPADTPRDAVLEVIHRDGAVILEGVLDDAGIARFRADLDPYMEATENGADDFAGRQTTRTGALVARSAVARDMVMNRSILDAAEAFLDPYCMRIQLHLTQIIRIRPGQGAQTLHRDRWAWGKYLQGIEPQFNTIWAMTDFTRENGATQVVPGSIDWPDDRQPSADEICQAEMSAGSVLLYTGSVFHSGGENRSNGDRIGVNITYTLGWLRQEENQYLSCPPEIARDMPEEVQKLLGYQIGSYALGYYTPPLPPGEAPEIVGPEYALGVTTSGHGLGSEELFAQSTQQ